MVRFEYLEPKSLEEAIAILREHGDKAKVLAGGTDLLIYLKQREMRPQYVVNIKRIPGLDSLNLHDGALRMGCLTTMRQVETSPLVRERFPILSEAARLLGSVQIRNLATVAGNLCNAAPSAEMAPPLLVLDARVKIVGPQGERRFPLEEFFLGPGKTVLQPGELLVELEVPAPPPRSGGVYLKLSPRKAMDIAVVGVASFLVLGPGDDTCADVKIALGAVAPTPLRAKKAEGMLRGQRLSEELIEQAALAASEESKPITDIRASDGYRKEMVRVLTRRATRQALEKARG